MTMWNYGGYHQKCIFILFDLQKRKKIASFQINSSDIMSEAHQTRGGASPWRNGECAKRKKRGRKEGKDLRSPTGRLHWKDLSSALRVGGPDRALKRESFRILLLFLGVPFSRHLLIANWWQSYKTFLLSLLHWKCGKINSGYYHKTYYSCNLQISVIS